jgi:hypothetical protein
VSKILQEIANLVLPHNPIEFWALVTGVGTVLLIVVAWRGLSSLGLTQKDMLTRAKRDARQTAITRAEEWASEIVPMNYEVLRQFAANNIPVFVKTPAQVRFDPDNQTDLQAAQDWVNKLPGDTQRQSLTVVNRVEAWSMYFTNGLADSKVASGPCAAPFCSLIIQNYALLLIFRAMPSSGKFPNTITLFKAWLADLDEQERGLKKGALLRALRELQSKGPSKGTLPDPLGLDGQ